MVESGPILVIIPALNEEIALRGVIDELRAWSPDVHILVVDDGSSDSTTAVARAAGVPVAPLVFNLGVGGALQTGFRYAVRHGFTRAVQFDGDGQHDASEIPALLAQLDRGADLVIGSRFAPRASTTDDPAGDHPPGDVIGGDVPTGDYSVGRIRGNAMRGLQLAVRVLGGRPFTDASSGFRAFSAPLLDFFARRYPNEFLGDTAEALLLACRAGFVVVEVPVRMRPRAGGVPSNGSAKMAYHYIRVLVSMIGSSPMRRTTGRQPLPDSGPR
ncbi:MAG TPA: glycosyltransferase family 2 protein [Acidimicrobiales bacterium]|nr:glycosyltransferase family 2 protein [Acidimicrobiales bacterium]